MTVLSPAVAGTRGMLHLTSQDTVVIKAEGHTDLVCGRCDSVLVKGADGAPRMLNAGAKCNHCGTLNDLDLPAKYPGLFRCTAEPSEGYTEYITASQIWRDCPFGKPLTAISDDLLRNWIATQQPRPKVFFHYTTPNGIVGILQSHRIWASDAGYLNDSSEFRYANELIVRHLLPQRDKANNPVVREFWNRAVRIFDSGQPLENAYVACFCEDGDLLGQWRGYGANLDGYAVELDAYKIGVKQPRRDFFLRKVVYDESTQTRLVYSVIQRVAGLVAELAPKIPSGDPSHILPSLVAFLEDHLKDFLYAFKHPAFSAEKEWRAVFYFKRDRHLPEVKFRTAGGVLVPYVELDLKPPYEAPLLPITRVVLGPSLHTELRKNALLLLLQRHDYHHVDVDCSKIPLRY